MTPHPAGNLLAEACEHDLIDASVVEELSHQLEAVRIAWPDSADTVTLSGRRLHLEVSLRGVGVGIALSLETWPDTPPELRVTDGPWFHPNLLETRVLHLSGLEEWNRTVTLDQLLRELERAFIEHPPQRGFSVVSLFHRLWKQIRP